MSFYYGQARSGQMRRPFRFVDARGDLTIY